MAQGGDSGHRWTGAPPRHGTPQGGIVSPVLANVYLHHVLDLWFERVVKPRCRGRGAAVPVRRRFRLRLPLPRRCQRFFKVLPQRLAKFGLEVAPEKTQVLRFSRFHPSMTRRVTFLGFELFWFPDREGTPRVKRRTARKKLQRCGAAHQGLDQGPPAPAGQGVYQGAQSTTGGALQLLRSAGQLARPVALLPDGDGVCVQMAESARWQAQELYLAGVQSGLGEAQYREAPHHREATSHTGVCMSDSLARKRVQPRNRMRENCTSGTVPGAPGNRRPYG